MQASRPVKKTKIPERVISAIWHTALHPKPDSPGRPLPFFFRSVFFHGFLLALLWGGHLFESPISKPPVVVDVQMVPRLLTKGMNDKTVQSSVGAKGGRPRQARLRELGPEGYNLVPTSNDQSLQGRGQFRSSDISAEHFSATLGVEKDTKFFPFANKLYRQIDRNLGYPPDFVLNNIEGSVHAEFIVDAYGKFSGTFTKLTGEDSRLKLYTAAMIAYALRQPMWDKPQWSARSIPIAVHVTYRLYLPDEFAPPKPAPHHKNYFVFVRNAFTEPKTIKQIKRWVDKYMPPVVPIPGGFFIDFVALYKRMTERDSDDPMTMSRFRLEMDEEQWRQTIRNTP